MLRWPTGKKIKLNTQRNAQDREWLNKSSLNKSTKNTGAEIQTMRDNEAQLNTQGKTRLRQAQRDIKGKTLTTSTLKGIAQIHRPDTKTYMAELPERTTSTLNEVFKVCKRKYWGAWSLLEQCALDWQNQNVSFLEKIEWSLCREEHTQLWSMEVRSIMLWGRVAAGPQEILCEWKEERIPNINKL